MHFASLVLAILATNLFDLVKRQDEGVWLPPYRLEATVTHVIPTLDHDGGIPILELGLSNGSTAYCTKFLSSNAVRRLDAGDRIIIEQPKATADWTVCGPITATILTHASPQPPIHAKIKDVLYGKHDCQFVRIQGLLRNIHTSELNAQWICVVLKCKGMNLYAATPSWPGVFDKLNQCLDSEIALEGIVLPRDGSQRRRIGRVLHFIGPESIQILKSAPNDPSLIPELERIDNLPPSEIANLPMHRIRGKVMTTWDEKRALLVSDSGSICQIDFLSGGLPNCNDRIEAFGYPECDLLSLNLSDARWRNLPDPLGRSETDTGSPDSRVKCVQPDQVRHGRLVRLRGSVVALPVPTLNDRLLHLNCGGQIVPINAGPANSPFDHLRQGMEIEVTGLCIKKIENYSPSRVFPRVTGFFVILRTASDIRIVSYPSWWTPVRTWSLIGLLLAALTGILVWNASLRKMATRKSRQLFKEQLGHVKADLRTEERTRLAVELHDTLAQNLTGVSMEIEAAHDLRGDAPQLMLDHLGIAAKALKSCRDELRNCLWDLRSQALDEPDMARAILRTLQPYVNDSNLNVRFDVPRNRLSDNTAHTLLRVIRELVVNAIRHGAATSVRIAGAIGNGKLLCSVTDNGCGFNPDTAVGILQGHFGLQGIRERIDEVGGEFTLKSSVGKGTKATIAVPLPREDQPPPPTTVGV